MEDRSSVFEITANAISIADRSLRLIVCSLRPTENILSVGSSSMATIDVPNNNSCNYYAPSGLPELGVVSQFSHLAVKFA